MLKIYGHDYKQLCIYRLFKLGYKQLLASTLKGATLKSENDLKLIVIKQSFTSILSPDHITFVVSGGCCRSRGSCGGGVGLHYTF